MNTHKLTPKQIICGFILALAIFTNVACFEITPGDALGIACSVDPNNANCQ